MIERPKGSGLTVTVSKVTAFAGALTVAVALWSATALAGKAPIEKSRSKAVPEGVYTRTQYAKTCGRHKLIFSFGFDLGDFDPGGPGPRLTLAASGGRAYAYNSGESTGEVSAFAYCAGGIQKIHSPDSNGALGAGGSVSVEARCDRGDRLLGGGLFIRLKGGAPYNYTGLNVTASQRVGKRGWLVEAENGGARQYRVYSFPSCAKKGPKLKLRSASETAGSAGELTVVARCRRKEKVYSGGFEASPGARVLGSRRKNERTWEVRAFAAVPGQVINASANCKGR